MCVNPVGLDLVTFASLVRPLVEVTVCNAAMVIPAKTMSSSELVTTSDVLDADEVNALESLSMTGVVWSMPSTAYTVISRDALEVDKVITALAVKPEGLPIGSTEILTSPLGNPLRLADRSMTVVAVVASHVTESSVNEVFAVRAEDMVTIATSVPLMLFRVAVAVVPVPVEVEVAVAMIDVI